MTTPLYVVGDMRDYKFNSSITFAPLLAEYVGDVDLLIWRRSFELDRIHAMYIFVLHVQVESVGMM
jgi:hypothetical protein